MDALRHAANRSACASTTRADVFRNCAFPARIERAHRAANGHFHSRGRKFDIFTWDGVTATQPPASDRFYESLAWK